MRDCWDDFWAKRNKPLTNNELNAFRSNFAVIYGLASFHLNLIGKALPWKTLEIGCGRATISDYFRRFGCETWTMDLIARVENTHSFSYGDVSDTVWNVNGPFDVIFSYGLLEHFDDIAQEQILNRCDQYLDDTGVQVHYVVPRRIVNYFEDKSVSRGDCKNLIASNSVTWVYPVIGNGWITNKWLGKGFVFARTHEDTGSSDSKITKH